MPNGNASVRCAICLIFASGATRAALPEPPNQHAPWIVPSGHGIPDYVGKVAATLFDAGLADPRGGEYSEITLPIARGDHKTTKTHGWVFSGEYAVCWDGLTYRVLTVDGPANLDADVGLIASARPWRGRLPIRNITAPLDPRAAFWSDMETSQTLAPASISLLLRLGRPDLAALLWASPEERIFGPPTAGHEPNEGEWLSTAATAWFTTAYRRMVTAFEGGHDREAADLGESILTWRSRAPAEWRRRNPSEPGNIPAISFLDYVPDLLADSQRRLRSTRLQPAGVGAGASDFSQIPSARIANLIGRLDDVHAGKPSFPGPLLFAFDPVYESLRKEGDAAVDALLDSYENDRRLTRTFEYSRPWSIEYVPVSVRDVVKILLADILGDKGLIANSTPVQLREWWQQRRLGGRVLRNLEALADDHAGPKRWLDSATYLTTRSDVDLVEPGRSVRPGACEPNQPLPAPHGDSLRSREPKVRELLAGRVAALVSSNSSLACSMAVRSALWFPAGALPVLRTAAQLPACKADAPLTVARLSLGDSAAASEWVSELRAWPNSHPWRLEELYPVWMFPSHPGVQAAADWLFGRPDARLSPTREYNSVSSPLLVVPSYRAAVVAALSDTRTVGNATRTPDGSLSFHLDSGTGGGSMNPGNDPRQARPGEERPVRVKDMVAWHLTELEGAPSFDLDWPERDKDLVISAIAALLNTRGSDLRAFPARLEDLDCVGERLYWKR